MGFPEVEATEFLDIWHMKVVRRKVYNERLYNSYIPTHMIISADVLGDVNTRNTRRILVEKTRRKEMLKNVISLVCGSRMLY